MTRTGTLTIELGLCRIDGTLLAQREGLPNPFAGATQMIRSAGLRDGERVVVTGMSGVLRGRPVYFLASVRPAPIARSAIRGQVVEPSTLETVARAIGPTTTPLFDLSAAESQPVEVSPDLDPRLQWWVVRRQAGESKRATASTSKDEVAVIARVTQPTRWEALSEVRAAAVIGRTPNKDTIVTGRIPISRIEAVRSQSFVRSLKAAQDLEAQLDRTTIETESRPQDLPVGHLADGSAGVVVGIIDYGGDFAHENFRLDDGRTRLLALWNQDASSTSSSPFGYGREHTAAAINAALTTPNPYAALNLSIAVGSYDGHKPARPLSFFSSAGPTRDERQKPEVSAPGHDVRAALSSSGTDTRLMSGTSMAAPAVAGLIALMYAEARKRNRDLTIEQVREILIDSARRSPPAGSNWHSRYGHGRIHGRATLDATIALVTGGVPARLSTRARRRKAARRGSSTKTSRPRKTSASARRTKRTPRSR